MKFFNKNVLKTTLIASCCVASFSASAYTSPTHTFIPQKVEGAYFGVGYGTSKASSAEKLKEKPKALKVIVGYDLAGQQILGSVDVLIQASRSSQYGRKVTEIALVKDKKVQALFAYDVAQKKHVACELL